MENCHQICLETMKHQTENCHQIYLVAMKNLIHMGFSPIAYSYFNTPQFLLFRLP